MIQISFHLALSPLSRLYHLLLKNDSSSQRGKCQLLLVFLSHALLQSSLLTPTLSWCVSVGLTQISIQNMSLWQLYTDIDHIQIHGYESHHLSNSCITNSVLFESRISESFIYHCKPHENCTQLSWHLDCSVSGTQCLLYCSGASQWEQKDISFFHSIIWYAEKIFLVKTKEYVFIWPATSSANTNPKYCHFVCILQ